MKGKTQTTIISSTCQTYLIQCQCACQHLKFFLTEDCLDEICPEYALQGEIDEAEVKDDGQT